MRRPDPEPAPLVALRRAADEGWMAPGPLLVACSGGADSLALLHAAAAVGRWRLGAAYLDHGLGAHRAAAAAAVEAAAAALNIPFFKEILEIGPGEGWEDRARRARHAALERLAAHHGYDQIALAHTREDQLETLLMRWGAGAGLRGLAGMPRARGRLRRPWLGVARDEVRAWLAAQGVGWVEDPGNADDRVLRARVRAALPALDAALGPGWRAAAATSADLLRDAEAVVAGVVAAAGQTLGTPPWPVAALRPLPATVRHRLVAEAIGFGDPRRQRSALAAIDRLITGARGTRTVALPGGRVATRAYEHLHIGAPAAVDPPPSAIDVVGPGRYTWGTWTVTILPASAGEPADQADRVTADALPFPWVLRAPQPGDRLRLLGAPGHKPLNRLFIDARVPRAARAGPVLADPIGPFWVRGLRIAERARVATGPAWQIEVRQAESSPPSWRQNPANRARRGDAVGCGCGMSRVNFDR